jgi:hypothetical protein
LESLAGAFYRHPAFLPHRQLSAIRLTRFWEQNAVVTTFWVVVLTLCAWKDHSFVLADGFGYFQHPGVFGWYLIQLVMPIAIYASVKMAARSGRYYRELIPPGRSFRFRERVFAPMVTFIGLGTPSSRALFALLFSLGFAAFAWNTFQNLAPGRLAPLDFWDSIHFPFGYFGSRAHKFYIDALLLPSIVHIFAGIVWSTVCAIRRLITQKKMQLAPFNPDGCGGFGFLADLILSPTIWALLVSGLAFYGVVYTHHAFDVSTVTGILVQVGIFGVFYIGPTFFIRSMLVQVKKRASREVHRRQEAYYEAILSGHLHEPALREAHDYLRYFNDISATIEKIPNWPHLAKASGALGISISPALIGSLLDLGGKIMKLYPSLH